jgi:hypothetical protein
MTLDIDIAAGERARAARNLIDRAQDGLVELAMVTALELCWLGGPAPPRFDEMPARAWTRLGRQQRRLVAEEATRGLGRRGLLAGSTSRTSPGPPIGTCALTPELGLVLAARRRPAFVVIVQAEDRQPRTVRLFAVGDQAEPVRGFVLETPGLPPNPGLHFAEVSKLGPLSWFYRYVLVSRDMAADALAQWTVSPPLRPGAPAWMGWLVSVWYPGRKNPAGHRLRIRGDGTKACLDGLHQSASAQYDAGGLRGVLLDLLTDLD